MFFCVEDSGVGIKLVYIELQTLSFYNAHYSIYIIIMYIVCYAMYSIKTIICENG